MKYNKVPHNQSKGKIKMITIEPFDVYDMVAQAPIEITAENTSYERMRALLQILRSLPEQPVLIYDLQKGGQKVLFEFLPADATWAASKYPSRYIKKLEALWDDAEWQDTRGLKAWPSLF
jgi:hypothetical protein